jgi:hypothetical protein
MTERIETLFSGALFLTVPAEAIVKTIVDEIKLVPQFAALFGTAIDPYCRRDYSERELPALRVYWQNAERQFENWFFEGSIICECIFPASLRRNDLQRIQDYVSGALLLQFSRPPFFTAIEAKVPGLNELGKRLVIDKALGFEFGDTVVPLTQITANFRVDLREWNDEYMPSQDRTKEDPFDALLGDLTSILTTIEALRDNGETELTIQAEGVLP